MDGRQAQLLLRWYAGLRSRTVDLVGDYAGDEPFIIEGDSLLLHSFSDDKLDFDPGLQVLHATYILEKFLSALKQRKCNFRLVFFEENAGLCVPPGIAEEGIHWRYLLAREAIVRHLRDKLDVKVFESYASKEFKGYLAASGSYFLMCHDGAFPEWEMKTKKKADSTPEDDDTDEESTDESTEWSAEGSWDGESGDSENEDYDGSDSDDDDSGKNSIEVTEHNFGFRSMIRWFISRGYNIALINELECRDTKAMAMIVEGSAERARRVFELMQQFSESKPDDEETSNGGRSIRQKLRLEATSILQLRPKANSADSNEKTVDFNVNDIDNVLCKPTNKERLLPLYLRILEDSTGLSQSEWAIVSTLGLLVKSGLIKPTHVAPIRAMLLHVAISREYRLTDRSIVTVDDGKGKAILNDFAAMAYIVLTSNEWDSTMSKTLRPCDLADIVDGRLFLHLLGKHQGDYYSNPSVISKYDALASLLKRFCAGVALNLELPRLESDNMKNTGNKKGKKQKIATVLSFKNSVFDAHLAPIQLSIDKLEPGYRASTEKVFSELSHWHNHRRPVNIKAAGTTKMDEKKALFAHRRNQFFMAEMRDYAASLTNATGNVLEPETVFVQSAKDKKQKSNAPPAHSEPASLKGKGKIPPTKPGKKNAKPSVRDAANLVVEKKRTEAIDKQIQAWAIVRADFDKESDPAKRYVKSNQYLNGLPKDKRAMVQGEVLTYLLSILAETWMARCAAGERENSLHIAALIWEMSCRISKLKDGPTPEIVACVTKTLKVLRLPDLEFDIEPQRESKLSFKFVSFETARKNIDIGLSTTEFQLLHAGPFFDRNMGSAPDPRVQDFEPDKWQREVLDEIDKKNSLFVVAPTSAGKTFISFYAMKKVLEEDNDSVLVYVAPTKALVNQIAAEVQARFSKVFKYGGKSVWGIHTRDYRINNPTGCQVLVTVPHILQIMLLSPANANSWSSRVKRIIFDEVHCISQANDGVVWEQLLLMAPCPIIALSATVGNPEEFGGQWLQMAQRANNIELKMIEHRHRYSDLRKYVYHPPKQFHFNGLPDVMKFPSLGLDSADGMAFMHPVASLVDRSRGMPDDLTLEARDCWLLWTAMTKYQTTAYPVDTALDPSVILPNIVRKVDIINWEAKLKLFLKDWLADVNSPFEKVLEELEKPLTSTTRPRLQISSGKGKEPEDLAILDEEKYVDTTLPLICTLHEQGALPALFFNYDRTACEVTCLRLLEQLETAEDEWKNSSSKWKNKITAWEAWKEAKEKLAKKKPPTDAKKKGKKGNDDMDKEDRMQDAADTESSPFESFDPDSPVDGFHFADVKKVTPSDFEKHANELRRREVPEWLVKGLRRGIGVHHAGMNRKYRQLCETLFRKGYLRVVVATGTLALGINMPCKTVVFSGDSIFLTALNFRQAAGRAGRRGFDMLGNVVFQAVPYQKVCRLLSSRLPDLKGHFPITTSLVLRLFTLLHESKRAPGAVKMINSILSCPHIYLGGPAAKHTVLHHLRFSIEYLRRNHLLDPIGAPLNFAGCVSHLYFVENASFAFHALLKDGYFHEVCKDIPFKPQKLLELMLVMSHLFGRQYLRQAVLENKETTVKKSPSVIALPQLPAKAKKALRQHNKETLQVYTTYVRTFVAQHIQDKPDCHLPLTGIKCGGNKQLTTDAAKTGRQEERINSAFVALSGHQDKWKTVPDLCDMVRSGVWLEKSVVPYVGVYPDGGGPPLNAYLYDFFKHGNVAALEKDNGVRKGDVWFVLNDFSLVLATIVTSFENFLKLTPGTDTDMIDLTGTGDLHEGEIDDKAIEAEYGGPAEAVPASGTLPLRAKQAPPTVSPAAPVTQKAKVVDSWDDGLSDEEDPVPETNVSKPKGAFKVPKAWNEREYGIVTVLKGFKILQRDFNEKFKKMWA